MSIPIASAAWTWRRCAQGCIDGHGVRLSSPPTSWSTRPDLWIAITSTPVGHGFTQANVDSGFASCSFVPKKGPPLKVIALDDTMSAASCANGVGGCESPHLDQVRYDWLVAQLDAGQRAGQLMWRPASSGRSRRGDLHGDRVRPGR